MSADCHAFRTLLGAALAGRPDPPGLVELGWHEHLLGCGDCRDLLAAEEALELLLASLPDPSLPPDLTRRVLARLRNETESTLDGLLDLDHVAVPVGLGARVRAGVAAARAGAEETRPVDPLDALLEHARPVDVPDDLARRVLAALRYERARVRRTVPRTIPSVGALRRAAAVLVAGLAVTLLWRSTLAPDDGARPDRRVARANDREVIASLPVLDYWDALEELDPLEQAIVAHLDLTDDALLEEGPR